MIFPTVHLNGTSQDELLDQLTTATQAIREAQKALANAAPNGRDYYVQSDPRAIYKAQDEHCARMQKLTDVLRELEEIAEHIALRGAR